MKVCPKCFRAHCVRQKEKCAYKRVGTDVPRRTGEHVGATADTRMHNPRQGRANLSGPG
jgi:hypothetical protein